MDAFRKSHINLGGAMATQAPRSDQNIERNYDVGVSHLKPARKKVAVFVTHGMGQPIPFQTLDQVAEALRKLDDAEVAVGSRL